MIMKLQQPTYAQVYTALGGLLYALAGVQLYGLLVRDMKVPFIEVVVFLFLFVSATVLILVGAWSQVKDST